MSDARMLSVLSSLSHVARQLDVPHSCRPSANGNCVKLDMNENPFPLPAIVKERAMAALERHHLYPENDNITLREAAACAYGFSPDQVIAGNGSSELLGLIYKAFLAPGDTVAMLSPGFSFNRKLAMLQDAHFLEIGWIENNSLPINRLLCGRAGIAKFIVLANPNNPTGTFVPIADIERLVAQSDRLIVLDEAYVDFAPDSGLRLVNRYPNLLLLRTFSKSYGVAGVRVGFGFGHPELVGRLRAMQSLFSMNVISQAVGLSILAHRDAYAENHRHIVRERERVARALSAHRFAVLPSEANFVLARVPPGHDGAWWQTALQERNVLVAFFPEEGLENCIRISIGTKAQMEAFLSAVSDVSISQT
ncbi:histidinol-phosphate transaminase [Bradyrhizobium sp. Cp5.3]|uniref:histidinol-phosphate transaminase n=1 Tax=Bradyrhizobium sp. Cp5.3 TaxID=443598 RepID=UPI00041BF3FE|nr:histidinol-phosphate transaminase [Bradyrhizobium sp. Cp5.3]